jgi:hypothetical protein
MSTLVGALALPFPKPTSKPKYFDNKTGAYLCFGFIICRERKLKSIAICTLEATESVINFMPEVQSLVSVVPDVVFDLVPD